MIVLSHDHFSFGNIISLYLLTCSHYDGAVREENDYKVKVSMEEEYLRFDDAIVILVYGNDLSSRTLAHHVNDKQ